MIMRSRRCCSAAKAASTIFMAFLLVLVIAIQPARAQTFKVLHTFHGGKHDGADPGGVLVRDNAGNLYGTAAYGGTGNCSQYGCGTVFKLNKAGKQVWLHSFKGGNGYGPVAGLLRDAAGNLFGTTLYGGIINGVCGGSQAGGCGLVFGLDKTGKKETVLYKFKGTPDGFFPEALLVGDAKGNLYGTTYEGGSFSLGAVFKVDPEGKETVLYNFTGGSDGCSPYPGVILDSAGNLYGVAVQGGDGLCINGHGVVFEVDPAGNETVLHTFGGGADGATPDSVLLFDSKGNLYGTTGYGGNAECGGTGCGVVFEMTPQSGGGWSESVLYAFCSLSNCADGESPGTGPLVRDSEGNLYGTTTFGGSSRNCNGDTCGVVFKLDTAGNETVLHSFTDGSDGAIPFAGLILDSRGNLYGTTAEGGSICIQSFTCSVVFKITP
jgi:uncharacterized repeat protein (TIGR03803 family)